MLGNPPVTTRQRATIIATQLEGLPPPSPVGFDDVSIQLNRQGPFGILEQDTEAGTSQFSNPTFGPSTIIEAFQPIALQHRDDQQRAN
jgi:hypothetical protein